MKKARIIVAVVSMLAVLALCAGCSTSASQNAQTNAQPNIGTVDTAYVQQHATTAKLVDTRAFEAFAGDTGDARPGHIPGAISIWAEKLVDKDGQLMSPARLVRMFEHQQLFPEDEIIVYGDSGREGAEEVAEALVANGYNNVSVYEAGYAEWSADTANEVDDHVESCCAV